MKEYLSRKQKNTGQANENLQRTQFLKITVPGKKKTEKEERK